MSLEDLSPTTKTKLINKLLKYTGFTAYQSKLDKEPLLKRLNDVVKINLEPRYVFDECIAYFGQNRIALAGYTTLQDTLIANRFEYFLYRKAEQLFHSNSLTVKESVNNRSLTSDLIQPKEWQQKETIIENTGLDKLATPINQTLADKSQQLEVKLLKY